MKKIVIPVVLLLALMVGTVGGLLWMRLDYLNYELDLVRYLGAAMEHDALTASYDGTVVRLDQGRAEQLRGILCRTERKLELFHPPAGTGDVLTLTLDDRLTITVEQPDPEKDAVYIAMQGDGVRRTYSLSGYNTMEWLKRLML